MTQNTMAHPRDVLEAERDQEELNTIREKKEFLAMFTLAGIEILDTYELLNPYWPRIVRPFAPPWYLFKTKYGLIRIGWRKRVISIGWEDTQLKAPDLTVDEVTKDDFHVHAWDQQKALVYLAELRKRLENRT